MSELEKLEKIAEVANKIAKEIKDRDERITELENALEGAIALLGRNKIAWDTSKDISHGQLPEVYLSLSVTIEEYRALLKGSVKVE